MQCIHKGFIEINSSSTIQDSKSSFEKEFSTLINNQAGEQNDDIAPIFGKTTFVEKYLESVTAQNSELVFLRKHKTLLRRDHESLVESVKLLSGGASIADPLYSGSIGSGMLTGAVFGEYKKSPPSLTILEVLRFMARKNKQGILVIVLNNLANRLNFGSACQSAAQEGIKTLLINVGEDVSGVSVSKTIGRKGLSGIKFLFKIAGAMSERKKTLQEIYNVIEKLKGNSLGSINVEIHPDKMVIGPSCKGEPSKLFFLWDTFDDIGEGARLSYVVRQALSHLFHASSYFSLHVVKGDKIVILVNNMGNLSHFYLSLIIKEVLDQTDKLGFTVLRLYSGRFLNSNLTGFSLSVLKIKDNIILELLDRKVNVTSWTEKSPITPSEPNILNDLPSTPKYVSSPGDKKGVGPKFSKQEASCLLDILPTVVESVKNMEEYLNKLDNDHDFGTAVTKFAKAIEVEINKRTLKISSPYEFLEQMAYLAGFTMGGVSGGIFSILFSSAAQVFQVTSPTNSVDLKMWVDAARSARDGLMRYTRVQPGDGTIIDALDPFVEYPTEHSVRGLSRRVTASVNGAEASKASRVSTKASHVRGGTSDMGPRAPDPGALCLAVVIRTIFNCLQIELAEAEAKAQAEQEAARKKETRLITRREDETRASRLSRVSQIKEEEIKKASKLKGYEESKPDTELKSEKLKLGTMLTVEKSKHSTGTQFKDEESMHGTVLKEGESKHSTRFEDEESKLGTIFKDDESKHSTRFKDGESKLGTVKEGESKHSTRFKDEESKLGTVKEGESKHSTRVKDGESKLGTVFKEDESKPGTQLKYEESKHSAVFKETESKYITELQNEESKGELKREHSTEFKEEESKLRSESKITEPKFGTQLKVIESKYGTELKASRSRIKANDSKLSSLQKIEQNAQSLDELKEVVEEIANEIENEVPGENS